MLDFNIVTIHRAFNYGAVLQTYALKTFISDLGFKVGVYDSMAIHGKVFFSIRNILFSFIRNVTKILYKKDYDNFCYKFKNFIDLNFNINKMTSAKIFLAGSDQIWNPCVYNPDYYLEFMSSNSIKASYAASVGVSNIQKEYYSFYKNKLQKFDYISVREHDAKISLKKILGYTAKIRVDLDPVFLLSKHEWDTLASKSTLNIKNKYILLYILHIPKNLNKLCNWIKRKTNYDIVLIDTYGYMRFFIQHDFILRDVGPHDFISLIKNSEIIITTSFHGTAFSILFEKEFYAIINPSFPSRIINILNFFGIGYINENQYTFHRQLYNHNIIKGLINNQIKSTKEYIKMLARLSSCR